MTVEEFREQAIKNGTIEKLKTQKILNTPIHFYNQNDARKELKEEMNKLKKYDR